MKVLFITTQFPFPLDNGGKIGAYNGLSVVSQNNDVTCLSFAESKDYISEGLDYYKEKLPNVTFVEPIMQDIHIRDKKIKLVSAILKGYVTNHPYVTSKFENNEMFKKIDECFKSQEWNIVFIDYLNMYIYGEFIKRKYKGQYQHLIFKDHNKEYEIVKQAYENEHGLKKIILNKEWKRTFMYEKKAINGADIVFSVCEDNTLFMKKYNINTYTMLPIFSIKRCKSRKKTGNKILYMGNLSWGANMKGVKWFVDKVLPQVRAKLPDTTLTIVGSGPVINPFSDRKEITYKGYVKNIDGLYDDYAVFIVPLFEGSGIRIKILDAFNNDIPVVSTLIGCETINVKDRVEIMIANDVETFSSAVIELLNNEKMRHEISRNAKKYLEREFSLSARVEAFEGVIRGMINE